jgi:hypothetical protein
VQPFVLVPSSAVAAIGEAAREALSRWSASWGANGDTLSIDVIRLEDAALPTPPDEWHALHAGWMWKAAGLSEHVAAAIGLPYSSPVEATAASMGMQSVHHAVDALATEIVGLLRDLRDPKLPPGSASFPTTAFAGQGLVLVTVRRGLAAFALLARASAFKAQANSNIPAAPALKRADLETSLRTQNASLEVILGHTDVSLADMMDLGPGDVLVLDRHINQPLVLSAVHGQVELPVHLGRQGDHFAVQIMRPQQS